MSAVATEPQDMKSLQGLALRRISCWLIIAIVREVSSGGTGTGGRYESVLEIQYIF